MKWRGAAVGRVVCTALVSACDVGSGYEHPCGDFGEISVDEPNYTEVREAFWEVELISAPGVAPARYSATCRIEPGESGPGGTDAGLGMIATDSTDEMIDCQTVNVIRVQSWPHLVRVRTRAANDAWVIDEWVQVELEPPGWDSGCVLWVLELMSNGAVAQVSPSSSRVLGRGGSQ